jgi:hypothetical protein
LCSRNHHLLDLVYRFETLYFHASRDHWMQRSLLYRHSQASLDECCQADYSDENMATF